MKVKAFLEHKAYNMRISSVIMTSLAGSGHPTSALSAADLVAALFFYAMHYDPNEFNFFKERRDAGAPKIANAFEERDRRFASIPGMNVIKRPTPIAEKLRAEAKAKAEGK